MLRRGPDGLEAGPIPVSLRPLGWRLVLSAKRAFSCGLMTSGCGQETACAYYDGDRKVRLCPECLDRLRKEPGTREVLLAEGPGRAN